jgi:IS605 OrfB family transposase
MQTLTLRCTIKLTPEQEAALEATVQRFAEGCNHALKVAKEHREFRRFRLHRLVYSDLREMGLSANLAVQAIARVGRKRGSKARFYRPNSCTFDQRTLSLRGESVSLTTVQGRLIIPLKLGSYQREVLEKARGVQGGILVKAKGTWYINLTLRLENPEVHAVNGTIVGVDLGQKVLATLSNGVQFSGGPLKGKRLHYREKRSEIRSKLDTERTKGLKNLWERLSGKERSFVNHTLHTLSRRIVDSLNPGDTLAIENLKGIRANTTKRGKKERHLHSLWPYSKLRFLLDYKAALKGVRVVAVDPSHTSQECPRCGHIARENRKSQSLFRCQRCGFQHNADWVASINIAQRAGSMGMGCCKPAQILRVSSIHRLPLESPQL